MPRRILGLLTLFCAVMGLRGLPAAHGATKKHEKRLDGYAAIVVKDFTVEKSPATEDFPLGMETAMQSRTVAELLRQEIKGKKHFAEVVDGATPFGLPAGTPQESATVGGQRRLVLTATVFQFKKGNRAARYVAGFGAGESKLKIHVIVADEQTGAELLSFDQQGTFSGTLTFLGGSAKEAASGGANDAVDGLVREIIKNF